MPLHYSNIHCAAAAAALLLFHSNETGERYDPRAARILTTMLRGAVSSSGLSSLVVVT
jgi:hypothetical protein